MNSRNHLVQMDAGTLQHIVERIVKALKPRKIILCGSRAERRAQEESDVDLLVILDAPLGRKNRVELESQLSREAAIPVQLITMVTEVYEETKDTIGGIAYPATKYGVVIYENP